MRVAIQIKNVPEEVLNQSVLDAPVYAPLYAEIDGSARNRDFFTLASIST
jgi:hypothetical protein